MVIRFLGITLALIGLGCSVNILKTFANTSTNEALYIDAQKDINSGDYSGALTKIGEMTGDYPTSARVLELKASAYGGMCGFNFLNFVQAIQGMSGTDLLLPFLLKNFDNASSTAIDACINAQDTIESIGAIGARTTDENFFLALIAMAKIGNILSYYADPTRTGSGASGFDPCAIGSSRQNSSAPIEITDDDAREIGTGLSLAVANLQAVAGSIQTGSGLLTGISNVCSALPSGYDFCSVTDPTSFTTTEVKGIRSLIKENSALGLGTNCSGDLTACNCLP